jgi:hypothetical protein
MPISGAAPAAGAQAVVGEGVAGRSDSPPPAAARTARPPDELVCGLLLQLPRVAVAGRSADAEHAFWVGLHERDWRIVWDGFGMCLGFVGTRAMVRPELARTRRPRPASSVPTERSWEGQKGKLPWGASKAT